MLRTPYLRATLFVVGLGFLIQITGINAVVFYSPMIFKEMGFKGNAALLLLPALVQLGSLVATLVSLSIVDRLGRRPTLLTGIGAMVASTLLLVACSPAASSPAPTGWLGFLGVFVFTAGFNFGFGSLVWVYASESFPARLRTTGASAMLTANLVANLIIALYFLSALESLGGTATFAMFAALAAIAFVFVWWLAPETKGRPLEDIRDYWENGGRWPEESPTGRFVRKPDEEKVGTPLAPASGRGPAGRRRERRVGRGVGGDAPRLAFREGDDEVELLAGRLVVVDRRDHERLERLPEHARVVERGARPAPPRTRARRRRRSGPSRHGRRG